MHFKQVKQITFSFSSLQSCTMPSIIYWPICYRLCSGSTWNSKIYSVFFLYSFINLRATNPFYTSYINVCFESTDFYISESVVFGSICFMLTYANSTYLLRSGFWMMNGLINYFSCVSSFNKYFIEVIIHFSIYMYIIISRH